MPPPKRPMKVISPEEFKQKQEREHQIVSDPAYDNLPPRYSWEQTTGTGGKVTRTGRYDSPGTGVPYDYQNLAHNPKNRRLSSEYDQAEEYLKNFDQEDVWDPADGIHSGFISSDHGKDLPGNHVANPHFQDATPNQPTGPLRTFKKPQSPGAAFDEFEPTEEEQAEMDRDNHRLSLARTINWNKVGADEDVWRTEKEIDDRKKMAIAKSKDSETGDVDLSQLPQPERTRNDKPKPRKA